MKRWNLVYWYVGTEDIEDDGVSFEDKISVISENLKSLFEQSVELQGRIKLNLKKVGIEIWKETLRSLQLTDRTY